MVAELLAAGAFAGAVTDPTPQDPVGKNPASIAAAWGHKGLAGYLSEVALTSHLSSLTLKESEISKGSAAVEAERTVEIVSDKSIQIPNGAVEDQLSLQDSLAAVRNAALAAARIQAAFRAHSFRRRHQSADASCDEYGLTADDIHGLSAASKLLGLRDHKLNTAALSIQKKYRGWKGRKEFLALRQNVVKIQVIQLSYVADVCLSIRDQHYAWMGMVTNQLSKGSNKVRHGSSFFKSDHTFSSFWMLKETAYLTNKGSNLKKSQIETTQDMMTHTLTLAFKVDSQPHLIAEVWKGNVYHGFPRCTLSRCLDCDDCEDT